MQNWENITRHIESVTGQELSFINAKAMHGGDINSAYRLNFEQDSYFVKFNNANLLSMFETEALGLKEMAQTQTLTVPEVVTVGVEGSHAYLVMEYMPLQNMSSGVQHQLGQKLAQLHQQPQPYFGWHHNNYIGSNLQINNSDDDWVHFWQEQRLRVQLKLAAENGFVGKIQQQGERLIQCIAEFFTDYQPQASLLHGDLWAGNAASDTNGQAVVYDPACYYGDREADIAMTELFGGYGADFYAAYNEQWSLDQGYSTRKKLYNLYHILNHLNLFGSAYLHQAESMMQQLIAETH